MACRSEYMNANQLEIELSQVLMLTHELDTGKPVKADSSDWQGYKKGVYGSSDLKKRTDEATANLCSRLKKIPDVSKYSLELQTWWRDHQAADRKREAKEKADAKKAALRASGLSKLTAEERKALGLN